jgi:crotonobetainyl-CoA:carnitine CoA-transferase CaiB-like acyl-CoA transferase
LRGCGAAAAPVVAPPSLLGDEQLCARGFWEQVRHPVVGEYLCTGMPFTFLGLPRRWVRTAPPVYGQHTREVLSEILGLSPDERAALQRDGVTSDRPAGL